ncbi:hypothetical protein D3C85_537610 [compost metagenome]
MEVREIHPQDLEASGLRTLLHLAREANGLSSMQHNLEHQLWLLNKSVKHEKRRTWVAVDEGEIIGMASLVLNHESPYYDTTTHRIEVLPGNSWELCGALVNPTHQKRGVYKALLDTRLAFLGDTDTSAEWLTIEVRAPYNEHGTPVVEADNLHCWRQKPYYIFGLISLKCPLVNETPMVADESQAVYKYALENGFEVYGINAYDNGPHMRRPL